jgi:hypothetical protein
MKKRVVLIHATAVAIGPIQSAFSDDWPEAELVNVLDDSLSLDLDTAGALTAAIKRRITTLAQYALDLDARGILFTCSAFGDAIELAKALLPIPVLKPNEAMFEDSMRYGDKLGLLATFGPSVPSMEREFQEMKARSGKRTQLTSFLVEDAMDALRAGDAARHNQLVAAAAATLGFCDAIMLAHFSTSQALPLVSKTVSTPVLTSPHSAVSKMRRLVEG